MLEALPSGRDAPGASSTAGRSLPDALLAAREALAAGDPISASAAAAAAWERCAGLQAKGLTPDPALVAEASSLVSGCLEAARSLEAELGQAMESAGTSRRAHAAYANERRP